MMKPKPAAITDGDFVDILPTQGGAVEMGNEKGSQRLSLAQLQAWEALGYGMFIHFGMSTFDGEEFSQGQQPSSDYAPDKLDVDQWISVARDAGMKYAVLTAKHVAGHCLWPSRHTDYHVGTSGNRTDVVEAFVTACEKRGLMPGIYYCSWDEHHPFGSLTRRKAMAEKFPIAGAYTTREYQDFQTAQLEELLTQYGKIGEVWIDIPLLLPRCYREALYRQIAEWQPEAVTMMNHGLSDGSKLNVPGVWPTDLISMERSLPNSHAGHVKWREVLGQRYYLPGEVCDTIGHEWFYTERDQPRSDEELLGMYLTCRSRRANFLLDVGPDQHGLLPPRYIAALMRLRAKMDRL